MDEMETNQLDVLWRTVLSEVELSLPHATFVTWFKPTSLISIEDQNLQVLVNNFFAKNQFEKKFDSQIKQILKKNGFLEPRVEYVIRTKKSATPEEIAVEPTLEPVAKHTPAQDKSSTGLNPKYRFSNFIVGSSNDLAHAAAQAAANMPGKKYNPIFIYGASGLGKTHLIQAIGNEILQKFPTKRVLYES
jgi:chromosomal replication initiator protein